MKKVIFGLTALLAACVFFMGCPNTSTSDPTTGTEETPAFTITFNASAQWAGPSFTVDDDWESLEVTFFEAPDQSKVQFCLVSDAVKAEQSWGTEYWSTYPAATETTTIVFDDWFVQESDDGSIESHGATKFTKANFQNKTTESFTLKVKSAKATKTDGTVVDVVPVKDWGSSVN